ncbi:putative immunity protein [Salinithrix halophila]
MEKFIDSQISQSIAKLLDKQDHKTSVLWAADCAEHVLPYFEKKVPNDKRSKRDVTGCAVK